MPAGWMGSGAYETAHTPDLLKELGYRYKDELPGGFKFDTRQKGNSNAGHSFEESYNKDNPPPGVVGRKLTPDERLALIEFLKSM